MRWRSVTSPCEFFTDVAENIVKTFQDLIITHNIPPKSLLSSLPEDSYNIIKLTHPDFTGSLPARNLPAWTPPQVYAQRPAYPTNRSLQIRDMNVQRGQSTPGYRPISTPGHRYPGTPATPAYNTPGAYNTPVLPGYRGVGRPRKYDIRR